MKTLSNGPLPGSFRPYVMGFLVASVMTGSFPASVLAQTPFLEEAEITAQEPWTSDSSQEKAVEGTGPLTPAQLDQLRRSKEYEEGVGNYLLRILRSSFNRTGSATIELDDPTEGSLRKAWLEKTLADHGCRIVDQTSVKKWHGLRIAKSHYWVYKLEVEGRKGILGELCSLPIQYRGTLHVNAFQEDPSPPNHDHPELQPILQIEREIVRTELAVLDLQTRYDRILRELEVNSVEATFRRPSKRHLLTEIENRSIPTLKQKLSALQKRENDALTVLAWEAHSTADPEKAQQYRELIHRQTNPPHGR